jgi:hypothetical protein
MAREHFDMGFDQSLFAKHTTLEELVKLDDSCLALQRKTGRRRRTVDAAHSPAEFQSY